jgi:2-polyprenyl-3-methyl-5-hydroxy-6-metoxy-1,4-benzoquinol methylase
MQAKPVARVRRRQRQAGKAGAAGARSLVSLVSAARQLVWYAIPGEQAHCPACHASKARPLQPLNLTRPRAAARRVGFISGCERCGVVFANPLPPAAAIDRLYTPDEWGQTRADHEPPVSRDRLARLCAPIRERLDVLRPPAGATVLDFGCGLGGMLDTLRAAGWTTYGIDPGTKGAFDRHRELPAIPVDPMFDLVILHHVIEHVINPSQILGHLARATRPGGFILVSVPNLDTLLDHRDMAYCIRSSTHVLAYSRDCLTWLLAEAGFRAIDNVDAALAASPRQVMLARREQGSLPRPVRPLAAARSVLAGNHEQAEGRPPVWPYLPVRVQAAVTNLRRAAVARA